MKLKLFITLIFIATLTFASYSQNKWELTVYEEGITPRHECCFIELNDKFYLLGGRKIKPVNIYDPTTDIWTKGQEPPIEIHHFQAISYNNSIYIMGAQTGKYPHETNLKNIYIYHPDRDKWEKGPTIPENIQRGASGTVVYKNKFYMVCGIINGHYDGHSSRVDMYDPKTNTWTQLTDAPRCRDHFNAVLIENKLYAVGGRRSSYKTKQTFELTIPEIDCFDLETNTWTTLATKLPTERAGSMSFTIDNKLVTLGGESTSQDTAHKQVEALDINTNEWSNYPELNQGRHGSQVIVYKGLVYVASGSGRRGGKPELNSMEKLKFY